jgi:hypothetical protein
VYNYEMLCLDGERTRSIWLTHPEELSPDEFHDMLAETRASVPLTTLQQWAAETQDMHAASLELGRTLKVSPEIMQVLESRIPTEATTFGAVLNQLIERLCDRHGFRRLTPTAVVVCYGHEVLAA